MIFGETSNVRIASSLIALIAIFLVENRWNKITIVKVLSLLEGCLYLISSPSPSLKIQIKGGKIVQKSRVQIPAPEGQVFLPFFFIFNILFYKSGITKNKHLIWFLNNKPRYQKMVNIKDTQFCMENLKMKRKKDKILLTFRCRDLNPRFSKIPSHDLIYWRWWNQIQARKLKFLDFIFCKFVYD